MHRRLAASSMLWVFAISQTIAAGVTGNSIEKITVFGSQNDLAGDPSTATEGVVLDTQLSRRPTSRVGELLIKTKIFLPRIVLIQFTQLAALAD